MAIRLLGSLLAERVYEDESGKIHIVQPSHGINFDARQRQAFEASDKPTFFVPVFPDNLHIVLVLWGGTPGETLHITGSFGAVGEKPGKASADLTEVWPQSLLHIVDLKLQGAFTFQRTGLFEMRLLANGEKLGVVNVVVRWDDQVEL